ncbi:hypothetical protein [Thalassoglobus sp.]|uniref:hypothetical protein n=1 Tax=Thalassoglobus sp. TaxID=2795869 RepID=UPI003AA8A021
MSPFNTRTPTVVHRPAEMERREAQIHDPYPDKVFGPDTGFRPLGFNEQRSEPQRAKDRFYTAMLRSQNANPFAAPQTMAPYPQQAYGQPAYPQQGYVPQQAYAPQQQVMQPQQYPQPQPYMQPQPQPQQQQFVQPQPYSPQPSR